MGRHTRGKASQAARLDAELLPELEEQLEAFRRKFGRDPGSADPVFFDPDADQPRPIDGARLDAAITQALKDGGVDPASIHAYQRTGMLVTRENLHQWSPCELEEFREALEEYRWLWLKRN